MYISPEPVLLAEHACSADTAGHCALCPERIIPGDRIARQTATGRWVHAACAAHTAGVTR